MHGNVFEWCEDSFADGYPAGESVDPLNRGTGQRRILRGGAWLYVTDNLRSSDRAFSPPDYRSDEYGFRCVMRLPRPGSPDDNVTTPKQPAGETNPPPMTADARAKILLSEAAKAVEDGNRYHAENLLNQAAQLQQDDPRLTVLRTRASALPVPKDTLVVDLGGGVSMEFVLIKPGTFTMGSDESALTNERPAHAVTITKPFYLGKYEVTQEQWLALMSRNLSTFKAGDEPGGAAKLPVENVSWDLCQSFVTKLSQRAEGHRFRLPTEAEWEYACRAGCTAGPGAPEPAAVGELAWFGENAGGRTHAIGTRKPNAWGLHDMYGNVWEWCEDWIGEYPTGPVSDPSGPASWQSTGGKVLRGGAWNNIRAHVNSTFRHDANPDMVMRYYGFRCAASVAELDGRAPASTP
jgi:formylglycine-generating enzyme required for sulfatase activity